MCEANLPQMSVYYLRVENLISYISTYITPINKERQRKMKNGQKRPDTRAMKENGEENNSSSRTVM